MEKYPIYKVKAGIFAYDQETKKVKVKKDKGLLTWFTNEEGENHASWVNLDTNIQQLQLIVFGFDAKFQQVTGQKNTFVLRFESNTDKYFFYLQEKIDPNEFVKKVRQRIEFVIPEEMEIQKQEEKKEAQKMEVEEPAKPEPQLQPKPKGFSPDFIAKLTNNLMAAASKKEENSVTHLSKVLTPDALSTFLAELTEQDANFLLQYLPEQQKDVNQIGSNVRSPQFQQALDVLSDALNSENVFPLFMELGLDQKYLKQNYGVHAFLLALQEWANKSQQKKEEK